MADRMSHTIGICHRPQAASRRPPRKTAHKKLKNNQFVSGLGPSLVVATVSAVIAVVADGDAPPTTVFPSCCQRTHNNNNNKHLTPYRPCHEQKHLNKNGGAISGLRHALSPYIENIIIYIKL